MDARAVEELRQQVRAADRKDDDAWLEALEARKMKEIEWADHSRDKSVIESLPQDTFEKLHGNRKYYSVVERSNGYIADWMKREAPGHVVLDYCCGEGKEAIKAAKAGAALSIGFDISPVSVAVARSNAEEAGVTNIEFFQGDAEATGLPDNSVDRILCSGVLHHIDLAYAMPEMRRILKPGGKIMAVEALNYNPLIKLYRTMTPQMRTEWEKAHILSLKDVKFASRFFEVTEVRYWHVVGYVAGKFPKLQKPLTRLDLALERVPLLNRMGWIFTFELLKPEAE